MFFFRFSSQISTILSKIRVLSQKFENLIESLQKKTFWTANSYNNLGLFYSDMGNLLNPARISQALLISVNTNYGFMWENTQKGKFHNIKRFSQGKKEIFPTEKNAGF